MSISEALEKEMGVDIKNICVNISTELKDHTLSFIEFETEDMLGIYETGDDGRERFAIINKKYIISLQVVYEQDINFIEDDGDVMIG